MIPKPTINTTNPTGEHHTIFIQLFKLPLSIQQMIVFLCALVKLPVFGISPDNIAERISTWASAIAE